MNLFINPDEAIRVYTDGSCAWQRIDDNRVTRAAYGWVVANAAGSMEKARVVACHDDTQRVQLSGVMETSAIVDAVGEFAARGKRIVVVTDCQSLLSVLEQIRNGDSMGALDYLLRKPALITPANARRFVQYALEVDFTLEWVKGHRGDFYNLVVDQMLRNVTTDMDSEQDACAWGMRAVEAGEAQVWSTMMTVVDDEPEYSRGYQRVYA